MSRFSASCFIVSLLAVLIHETSLTEICDMEELDDCARTALIFGDREALIPKDLNEMEERCHIDKKANTCWRKNLRACLKEPLSRQIMSLILKSVEGMVRLRCQDEEYRQAYMNAIDCIYKVKDTFHECMDLFIRDMYLASQADPEDQIPLACCLYNTYSGCALVQLKQNCGDEEMKFALEFLDGYAGDTLGLMCGGYMPGSANCKDLVLPTLEQNVTLPRSLLPPIIDMLDTLTKAKK